MASGPPFMVHIDTGDGPFGETMNHVREWLDHRKIQPSLFSANDHAAGFELGFSSEDEAQLFRNELANLIRRVGLTA